MQWRLLEETGPALITDGNGYLYGEGLRWTDAPGDRDDRAMVRRCLAFVSRRLQGLKARVIVAPVPPKVASPEEREGFRERYPRNRWGSSVPLYEAQRRELSEFSTMGIESVYLPGVFAAHPEVQVFARTDTHWTFEGARLAAEAVVRASGYLVPEGSRETRIIEVEPMVDAGNLLDVMGVSSVAVRDGGLEASILETLGGLHRISRLAVVDPRTGAPAARNAPMDAPVVVVGTSFSEAAEFIPMLQHYSGHRVYAVASPAGGVMGSIERVLRQAVESGFGAVPRCVIWEFPFHIMGQAPGSFARLTHLATWLPMFQPAPIPDAAPARGALKPGVHDLGSAFVSAHVTLDRFFHAGDGRIGVRLEGSVDAPVEVHLTVPERRTVKATWLPIRGVLTLPLIWPDVPRATISVHAPNGARLELKSVGAVWDLDTGGTREVELEPAPSSPPGGWMVRSGGGFAVEATDSIVGDLPEGSPLISVTGTVGEEARLAWTIPAGTRRAVLSLPVLPGGARDDLTLVIRGAGNQPPRIGVSVIPQSRLP